MAFSFGFGSNKQKQSSTQTTSIDPQLRGLQEQNYSSAQGLPQSYGLLSQGTIDQYMNPYTTDVVNASLGDLNNFRQMALNGNKEAAIGAGAFSSYDGRAIADSLTHQDSFRQAGLLSSQLRTQGYGQALQTAQDENRYSQLYPMARQGLLNSTLAGITPTVTSKGTSTGKSSGFNFGFQSGRPQGSFSQDPSAWIASVIGG
jgi:hypothetical protein